MWNLTPKISADIPHRLQLYAGLLNPLTEEIKSEIDNRISPVYKLDWRIEPAQKKEATVLDYLLDLV